MMESIDDKVKKLKDLMKQNEFLKAERLALLIAREFHLELMHNLKQQREQLLEWNKLLEEQRKSEKDRSKDSFNPD